MDPETARQLIAENEQLQHRAFEIAQKLKAVINQAKLALDDVHQLHRSLAHQQASLDQLHLLLVDA